MIHRVLLAVFGVFLAIQPSYAQKPSKWVKLFDGKTTRGWHNYGKTGEVKGWTVAQGALMTKGKSGDLISDQEYGDFEFEFEFKIPPKANSGIMYKVLEDPQKPPYYSGPEYQIIDDEGYPPFNDGGKMVTINDKQKTGANYDMQAPSQWVAKPAGQWNKGKIKIKDNQVEHWLNGVKVVEYTYGSEAWNAQLAASKFKTWTYATPRPTGKLALQDHGDEVWFRKMRIRTW